ncbi:AhpC/TSA family protein [Frankia sp. CNm7]|uniref:AhpC/TSA family protein n=1 Tax=Frankia nepalensis TaxID=1836974 RepID=A0A937UQP1_9ACTN|nr:peroxiredoxin-like family protein [Frankia nepalensis]MBL7496835.1 AhpC/TSA family protein [Frankia nepalensis]MBL7510954.1 AhpC/TSA family protein [Frankia nepalensis]MBL7523479.1 AhpC/TSA family protein [Frankia nepalensis]MBL7626911.1 AhpC/TSA family protein [Frankia nepalensis]
MYTPRNLVRPGTLIAARELPVVSGHPVPVPDPEGLLVHLQFRRFAGCPVCNLHLRSVARRHAEIEAAGVREVVVWHSSADELARYTAELPFAVVADPDKRLYTEFGVESRARALLDPRAWWPIARGVVRSVWAVLRGRERSPGLRPHGGSLGLPADFLIAPTGEVVAVKYGEHVYDQWSVDELLDAVSRRGILTVAS